MIFEEVRTVGERWSISYVCTHVRGWVGNFEAPYLGNGWEPGAGTARRKREDPKESNGRG